MKNQYKITKKLIMSWAMELHLYGVMNTVLFTVWCILGVIGVIGLILSVALDLDWMSVYLYSLIGFVAVFRLFISRFIISSRRYKMYSTTYGVTEWMRTIEFSDGEITVTDHMSVSKFSYGNIKKIKENGNTVMLFMNDNLALRLYKDAFVEGSWEECKQKIESMIK